MHIGGGAAALGAVRRRAERAVRTPAFGFAVVTPMILAGVVGASAPSPGAPVRDSAVTPLAAVESSASGHSGVSVVAVTKTPTPFHFAASSVSAPPAAVVNSPGTLRIPAMALSAYRNAERMMAVAYPACGISWNLLAGIGRIESMHANGGATDSRGTAVRPIYGPTLDGSLPGNEIIVQSRTADRVTYARAMGPMQFLPGTWSRYAADGDGDGEADVQNLFDSSLAAARYLCSGGLNLRDQSHVMSAILRYNNSVAYARNVLGWAAAYATGVVPMDLPPITGPVPALGDAHLENYEGLGPGMPINALGLPATDPLALMPVLERTDVARQIPGFSPNQTLGPLPGPASALPAVAPTVAPERPPWLPPWAEMPPWLQPQTPPQPECAVFCIQNTVPPAAPPLAPGEVPNANPLIPPAPALGPAPGPVAGPAPGPAPAEQPVMPPPAGPLPGPPS